jgi:hypothetical protein
VLRIAGTIPATGLLPTSNNRNRHLLDVAGAHVKMHDYAQAVGVLTQVRHDSPQWLPHQRLARDILGQIIARRRTLTPEMRELAEFISLEA